MSRWASILLAASLVFPSGAHAVGNDVLTDPAEAARAGFEAVDVRKRKSNSNRAGSDDVVVSFRIKISRHYDFGEMGTREFSSVGLIRPDPGTAPGPMLLGSDSMIPIAFDVGGDGAVTHQIRMRYSELAESYFEFGYAFEAGMVPLLVHIPCCSLLDVCEPPENNS